MTLYNNPHEEPLAIVGMACKYAGSIDSPSDLHQQVLAARSMQGAMPSSRMDASFYHHPNSEATGTTYTKGGYFLDRDVNAFDAAFFQLSELDVLAMDPQQKMLLENVYHALENAGIPLQKAVSSLASVFVGCSNNDHLALSNADLLMSLKGKGTGTSPSILANRISWFYDFRGTSQTIDTACSSSLVAFHQACMDSIVSGVNLIEHPAATLYLSNLGVLSPDGRSWSFDARANGYGRGEGLGTVIIKPLRSALRDGNRVRAVIRASGSNQDGRTPGITVPSVAAQEQLIRSVYESAGLNLSQTGYVEAHGTGTQVGDPLEVQAIVSALGDRTRDTPLYVGSVKSVVGHLEGGAGLAGLISAALAVESKTIPPVAGLKTLNPRIIQRDDLKFAQQATPWPRDDIRRASINSFGFGGTNAHVVLDDVEGFLNEFLGSHLTGTLQVTGASSTLASKVVNDHASYYTKPVSNGHVNGVNGASHCSWIPENRVFILSAFDEAGLDRNAASMISHLESLNFQGYPDMEEAFINDLCHTLNEKRTLFDWRSYHVADTIENLQKSLQNVRSLRRSAAPKTIRFIFTGQGANWAGMAQDLMVYPLFQKRIREAALFLRNIGCQWDLYDRITSEHGDLNEPTFAQSSCVAVQVALVDLLHSWKITPSTVVGHSSGEIAAAYCAGKISRQTAWKVAYCRGQVCAKQTHEDGRMLATAMPAEELERLIARVNKGLSSAVQVGCYNSPKNLTLTGRHEGILRVKGELDEAGVLNRLLPVKVAYHSILMRQVAPEYLELLGDLDLGDKINQEVGVTMISSVTGRPALAGEVENALYWVNNLVSPVRFSTALLTSMRTPNTNGSKEDALIEIGPHATLRSAINETLADHAELQPFQYGSLLKRYETDGTTILHTFGVLACYGHEINLAALNDRRSGTKKIAKILSDLPPYAFDHSRSVRGQTRKIEHIKFPAYKRHELLGVPVEDTNTFEQRWRNILRPDDITWLRMNRMKGNIHFPGVAYLLMAMEAAVQRAGEAESITGVRLGNVSMLAPLPVSGTPEGVEIISSIYPMHASSKGTDDWCTFRIISHDAAENSWIEHCVGSVRIETSEQKISTYLVKKESQSTCDISVDINQMYQRFGSAGMDFGEFLKNIQDMHLSADHKACTATIATPDIPKTAHDRYAIHPCTFESILHVLLHLCEATSSPMVTNYIEEIFISSPSHKTAPKFQASAATNRTSSTTWRSDVIITAQNGDQEISIKGLDLVQLPPSETESSEAESFYVMKWKPDVHLVTSVKALRDSAPVELHQRLPSFDDHEGFQLASAVFLLDTMDYIKKEGLPSLPDHQKSFMNWMQQECGLIAESSVPFVDRALVEGIRESPSRRKELFGRVASQSARGELLVRVGLQMIPILEQKVDCLDVMFGKDDLMDRTYEEGLPGHIASAVAGYVHCLAHSRTDIKVLEVGAGTGSATKVILDSLMPTARLDGGGLVSSVSTYHFTDISAAFFENATKRFPDWAGILRPQVLNIEKDPADQGFELGSYDLVIATHVLHATADLSVCLSNVKKLLKYGGDLILIENIKPELMCSPLGFGLLPGWWRSVEPYRQSNPLIDEDQWHEELQNAGLQHRLLIKDTDDQINEMSAFVAANVPSDRITKRLFSIIYSSNYPGQYDLACKTADEMTSEACAAVLVDLIDVSSNQIDTIGIILLGYQGLDLSELSSAEFEKIQYILGSFTNLLWVSRDIDETPKSALATGLVRTARWERDHDSINFLMLEIKQQFGDLQGVLSNITRVCKYAFTSEALVPRNAEYRLQDGILLTNRLFPASGINECIDSGSRSRSKLVELRHVTHPVKLTSVSPHQPNGFHFIEDEDYKRPLHPHEVQIEVRAVGIDEQDVDRFSRSIPGESLGWQGAGIVVGLGAAVQGLQVGDAVMALRTSGGPFQTFFHAHSAAVVKVPTGYSFTEAAALPVAFFTAYHCLANVARIQKEEKVLIHQATGGIGLAAVQIAQSLEATIYCTVSDDSQRQCILEMGIPPAQVLGTESWKKELSAVANSDKVDVILNLSPRGIESKDLNCLSSFGHLIDLHGQGILGPVSASTSNRTYSIVDIRSMALQKPTAVQDTLQNVSRLLAEQKIRPLSPAVFGFSGLSNALSEIRQGIPGPWVLEPRPTDLIPVVIKPLGGHTFDPNASYVLVGGFGGIGRSVTRWMVTRGARNFIFVSRSGASSAPAKKLYTELLASGCGVSDLVCDITNKGAVVQAISSCQTTMPPIKGCMQCSMVLEDSMLSNMTHTQFLSAITPKVQGTINLAAALSNSPLDFLILLSSSAGIIGNRGQANYSAANAFLDAFAASLVQKGYPATSISLGSVLSVGWVAENQDRLPIALSYGAISESLLLSILEYHMDPRWCAAQSPDTCHTVAGVRSAKDFHRQSIPLPGFMAYPLFSPLRAIANSSGAETGEAEVPVKQALRSARSIPAAVEVVTRAIVMKLARVMAISAKEVDPARTLASYGVDSLVTVDLKAWFKRDVGVNVASGDLLGDVSMQGLAEKVAGTSEFVSLGK
ncbi:type I polyketide synthase [Aspergillus affinis]|uniref:type I polyketide synthase n=1 Tax=Aspergillus affinis TaxID=1070780 RepID=UPI0022FEC8BF|nr:polyketide synthase [Aspergillus affinis]KAI9036136.1 polyketide synthase [Aspergillus affinis]